MQKQLTGTSKALFHHISGILRQTNHVSNKEMLFFLSTMQGKLHLPGGVYLMKCNTDYLIDLTIREVIIIIIINQFKTSLTSRAFEIIQMRQ